MNKPTIQLNEVSKTFGTQTVLNKVSLNLEGGKIYGLIGRNGSGKTVLMKCICGFLFPSEGEILINNQNISERTFDEFGIIIESPGFLPNYSARKNLMLLAMIRGRCTKKHIDEVLEIVGLDPKSPKKVSKFSMGMKQRLGIAQAIMENPDILILDEPMNGLDNHGVSEMRSVFQSLRDEGKLLLLASHNQDDIKILCDEIFEIDAGNLKKR